MKNATLNVRLLVRALAAFALLAVVTHLVHGWQMRRHGRGQLDRSEQAAAEGRPEDAVAALGRYLVFAPGDQHARARHALLLATRASTPLARWRALESLRRLLAREPGHSGARRQAVELALALGQPEEARQHLEALLAVAGNSREKADLLGRLAACQELAGDFGSAARSWEEVTRLDRRHVAAHAHLARLLRQRLHRPKDADAVLDDLVKANPGSAAAHRARAEHRRALGQLGPATADLDRARELAPADRGLLLASAELARLRGAPAVVAAGLYAEAIARAPHQPDAYLGRAGLELDRGQPGEAVAWLREGLRRAPAHPDLLFALADALDRAGRHQAAEAVATRLRAAAGKKAAGRLRYLEGRRLLRRAAWPEARRALLEASQAADLPAEQASQAQLGLARCAQALGQPWEQVAACRRAQALAPSSVEVRHALGAALVQCGAVAEALPQLRALVKLAGAPADSWTLLARALVFHNLSGSPGGARSWAEAEAALTEAARRPRQELAVALLRAEVLVAQDDRAGARAVLEAARAKHPTDLALWRSLVGLARAGSPDDRAAADVLRRADQALAGRVEWWLWRAADVARAGGPEAAAALEAIERRRLPECPVAGQERLARQLLELYARLRDGAGMDRMAGWVLSRWPRDLRARVLQVDARLARGDHRGARRLLAEVRRLEGPEGTAWRCAEVGLVLSRGPGASRAERERARALLAEVRKFRPGWGHPLVLEARLDEAQGHSEEALRNYRQALDLGDRTPEAVERAVVLLAAQGRYAEADRIVEDAQGRGALPAGLARQAAEVALAAGKPDRARGLALLSVVPGDYRDLIWLGRLLEGAGRPTEAEDALRAAVDRAPDAPQVWLALVALLGRTRQLDAAEEAVQQMTAALASARRPLALAQAREALGQFGRARQEYRQALAAHPREARVLREAGRFYARLDQNEEAARVLEALLDRRVLLPEEDLPEVRRRLALALAALGEAGVARALALLDQNRGQETDPVADRRTRALVQVSRRAERAPALRELELTPARPALWPEEKFRLAWAYEQEGDWPRALPLLRGLVELDGGNPAYLARLAGGLLRSGKLAEASVQLSRLREVEPDSPRTRELLGRLRKRRMK